MEASWSRVAHVHTLPAGTSTARHLRRTGRSRSLSHSALVLGPAAQRRWNVESAATGAALTGGGRRWRTARAPAWRPVPLTPYYI